ncbi:MAG: phosphodiester glycosidase family protein [Planctomycetes bacterium]|nr:phosphodiester glycosidase family protein [Planctomycetota bacterium]
MLLRTVFATVLLVAAATAQIAVSAQLWPTGGGTARGFTAVIDLTDPRLEIRVTAQLSPLQTYEAQLRTTSSWHTQQGNQLSINANYYGALSSTTADIVGLSKSNGVLVSPVRQFGAAPDPAIVFAPNRLATIGNITTTQAAAAQWAVAGVGPSSSDTVPGTLLVTNGANTGSTARVEPLVRNPRTAVGTNQAGTTLYVVVVDGRQPGWSVGMTLPELANVLLGLGAWRAINLDGGGSSSFLHSPPGAALVQNRPSDGSHRAVANHLGFAISQSVVVGSACGNGGTISSTGDFDVGSANFVLRLQGAPAGAYAFAGIGFPGNEISCGACTFLDAVSWTFVLQAGGSAIWPWAVPNQPSFVGSVIGMQWLLLNAPSTPCPLLAGLASTPRLHLTLGP